MGAVNNLVMDLTHGGVKIAISLSKKGKKVLAYDIYKTLKPLDKKMLDAYDVEIIELNDLKNFTGNLRVIYPIHLPLSHEEIIKFNPGLNYEFITHHQIIKEILKKWGEDIRKIEITGVKGKTSSVFMLKEILLDENPLILSSLGAILYENRKEIILKKNISITPANIKESIDLAYKLANPICGKPNGNSGKYDSAIFESSLGASGIGDVGLLTNIAENYPIANNKSNAATAKKQIFNCDTVVCEKECFDKYYSDVNHEKINTFSLNNKNADLYLTDVRCSLDESEADIEYKNLKTVTGKIISGNIKIRTFAPGMHLISNVLGVVATALSLEISHEKIINGLKNYKGIEGRSNKKIISKSIIIEEINPGINTVAIKESIKMIKNLEDYYVAIGGDYGITCEEIDEDKVSRFLDNINCSLILTGDVGKGIYEKMNKKPEYIKNYDEIYDLAINSKKNLLFIYRSEYNKLSMR